MCRVLTSEHDMLKNVSDELRTSSPFNLLKSIEEGFEFYWMLNNSEKIYTFKTKYDELMQCHYPQIAKLLSKTSNNAINKKSL